MYEIWWVDRWQEREQEPHGGGVFLGITVQDRAMGRFRMRDERVQQQAALHGPGQLVLLDRWGERVAGPVPVQVHAGAVGVA